MFEAVELAEASRKAASADVSLVSDGELCDAIPSIAEARAALDAFEAHVLAEVDVRGTCDREFGLATLWWVTAQTRAPRPVVAARLRMGVKLRQLDVVDEALAEGRITVEHARVLVEAAANPRISSDIVELQAELVAHAQQTNFRVWRSQMSVLERLLDQDGGFDPDRDLARNQLRVSPNGGDGVTLSGELVGEHALGFTQLLEAETDRLWRRHRSDHDECAELPVPQRSTLRALALVELITKGAAGHTPGGKGPVVDITAVIHHDQPDRAVNPHGIVMSRDVLRHLGCDPALTPIWFTPHPVNHDTVTVEMGREVRYATRAQRRALAARDGGCVFPGCDMPVGWCDAHHIQPWEHGGTTDLANLALLCRHHHGVTHRTGWTMTALADHTFTWTTPTGRTLHSQRHCGAPGP